MRVPNPLACAFSILLGAAQAAAQDSGADWAALAKGGHVALVRHGNAPGTGDPPGVRADDCKTQRNLDDAGRAQARALGEAFRSRNVRVGKVLSSPWCRCMDTARLMAIGPVEVSTSLLPDRDAAKRIRREELKEMISAWRGPGTLVLVTHGFAIQALFGFIPGSAETVVVKPRPGSDAGGEVVGRIAPPRAQP